ncbi:hypothetical protein KBB92_01920 [Candidatus Shapirobacteria bacterium]|nr:hypothetical protein [Candidatus Shapirobacteria bacterium]
MSKDKSKQANYFKLFNSFLKLEIPNIIQIITLLGFLGVLAKTTEMKMIISVTVMILLSLYLVEKLFIFINTDLVHIYAKPDELNVNKLLEYFGGYLIFFSFLAGIIIWLMISSISWQ